MAPSAPRVSARAERVYPPKTLVFARETSFSRPETRFLPA